MLQDLKRKLRGGWRAVALVTGQPVRTLCHWVTVSSKPSRAAARHIWLVWSLLCRPGEVTTVFHLSTCGRFTKRADPRTAGDRFKNRSRKDADMTTPPATCAECGQELPEG